MRDRLVPKWPLFRVRIKFMSTTALHSTLSISETVRDRCLVPKDHQEEMAYGYQMVTRPMTSKVLWGRSVGYPSDSLASCLLRILSRVLTARVNRRALTRVAWSDRGASTRVDAPLFEAWTSYTRTRCKLCCFFQKLIPVNWFMPNLGVFSPISCKLWNKVLAPFFHTH